MSEPEQKGFLRNIVSEGTQELMLAEALGTCTLAGAGSSIFWLFSAASVILQANPVLHPSNLLYPAYAAPILSDLAALGTAAWGGYFCAGRAIKHGKKALHEIGIG